MAHSPTVKVSLPIGVAGDIDAFKKTVGGVLERLGCPACCSGHDIRFELQREFVFDDKLKAAGRVERALDVPSGNAVSVALATSARESIDQVFASIDSVAERLGCPACCSGHDLRFDLERRFTVDSNLRFDERTFG